MNAEYVILELNGIVTYSYSLTAATAHCRSQPQNWSIFKEDREKPSLWNREVGSCPSCSLLPRTCDALAWLKICTDFYQSSHNIPAVLKAEDLLQSKFKASLGITSLSDMVTTT